MIGIIALQQTQKYGSAYLNSQPHPLTLVLSNIIM